MRGGVETERRRPAAGTIHTQHARHYTNPTNHTHTHTQTTTKPPPTAGARRAARARGDAPRLALAPLPRRSPDALRAAPGALVGVVPARVPAPAAGRGAAGAPRVCCGVCLRVGGLALCCWHTLRCVFAPLFEVAVTHAPSHPLAAISTTTTTNNNHNERNRRRTSSTARPRCSTTGRTTATASRRRG